MLPTSVSEEGQESIFETAMEDLRRRVLNPWRWFTIFQGAVVLVGDNLSFHGVYWKIQEEPWCLMTKVLET